MNTRYRLSRRRRDEVAGDFNARGGQRVDLARKDGKVTDYTVCSGQPGKVTVRLNGQTKTVQSEEL